MADLQVPPAVGTSGQRLDSIVINAGSTILRQIIAVGDPASSGNVLAVDSGGRASVVSASSGVVQVLTSGTLIAALTSGTVTATAATNPWSSAPGFNVPVVSASSGVIQVISTTPLPVDLYAPAKGATAAGPLTVSVLDADRNALIVTLGTALSYSLDSVLIKDSGGGEPIGANGDAATSTGSLHAKLRHLVSNGIAGSTALPAGSALVGDVGLQPRTNGGLTPYSLISAATVNDTNVKGSAGQVYSVQVFNANVAIRYLKLYDKASAPTSSDTPVKRWAIPGNSAGAGIVSHWPQGIAFASGIGFRITTGSADTDTGGVAAGEILLNLDYK